MDFQDFFKMGMARDIPAIKKMPEGLHLNLGAGNKVIEGALPLDYPEWDADKMPIPHPDGSVSGIHAYHFLEHIEDPISMLREFQRVLRPGGIVNICVPYYNSNMMAHDLTHKHAFCEETWKNLFDNPYYSKDRKGWKLKVGFNVICGIVERNMCLLTQLERGE